MTDKPHYAIPAAVLYREVDGQMVLLNLETEQYFGLNEVGADIVTRLTEQDPDEAFAALVSDYEVDPAVLRSDIDSLLASLIEAGLLQNLDGAG
ncbi:MAG TPA: PqqD family protein [Acidimicrobiales bacterium]|jgi:hypothetical protein